MGIFSEHQAVIQSQAQAHLELSCPRVAPCQINQLLLRRGTQSFFWIPIFTKLIGAHGVSGTCASLMVLANTDNYVKLLMSKVQALTACSAEVQLIKQTRKWAFTGAGKVLLQVHYQHCLPPGELERHKHIQRYMWFSVTVTGMLLQATTRRQALANELLKQSCSVISWMLLNPPLALKNKHRTTQTAWQKKITSKLCLGSLEGERERRKQKGENTEKGLTTTIIIKN